MLHRVLYDIIQRDNIILRYTDLASTRDKLLGVYHRSSEVGPMILLDRNLRENTPQHDVVLAEEIGHHETSPRIDIVSIHTYRQSRIVMTQDELKAIHWACDALIPDRELEFAIRRGYYEVWQIAEYFQVTEWLVLEKYGLLRQRSLYLTTKC